MAFTGAATFTNIGRHKTRVTGLSLAAGAAGTIGANGDATADEQLPASQEPLHANYTSVYVNETTAGGTRDNPLIWTRPTGSPIQITITNTDAAKASGALDITIAYEHTAQR